MDSTKKDVSEGTSHSVSAISPSVASNSKATMSTTPKSKEEKPKKPWFIRLLLLWLTLGAVVIGITAGLLLRGVKPSEETKRLVAFPGVIFMNMLKMMVVPLVITSLITGLSQISGNNMGRLIGITFSLYIFTTILAVLTGIALVLAIHPGDKSNSKTMAGVNSHVEGGLSPLDTVLDLIRNLFPPNIFEAFMKQAQTKYEKKLFSNATFNGTETVHKIVYRDGYNVIGLIALCIAVGICLSKMGKEKNRVVVEFVTVVDEVVTVLTRLIMWYSPIGIISFIIEKIVETPDLLGVLTMLSKFILTYAAGLVIHTVITLPLVYFALTRKNPLKVITGMMPACLIGCAAYSSASAMPTSLVCVEENLKVSKMVARFVVPIGVTINMNGTAVYEAVAAVFIAQLYGMPLTVGDILTVSVTGTLAAMATASVPHATLVTLVMVLASIGLPPDEISLLFAVDAIVGRPMTIVNVLGDGFVAEIVSHFIDKKENIPCPKGIEANESESPRTRCVSNELAEP